MCQRLNFLGNLVRMMLQKSSYATTRCHAVQLSSLLLDKCHGDVNGYSDGCTEKDSFGKVAALLIVTD